eukprot:gene22634-42976_t
MQDVRRGNFWGLPVNFLAFSLVTVVIVSGTLPVFGEMLHDPIATVSRIDNSMAVLLGAFAFVTATIGINIVANFVSPAFDFANVAPSKISWRAGGMIAAACTDLAGSSAWFERGFVTYSNAAKTEQLGVDAALIATRGAVSEPVVRAMVQGALQHSHAQVAVA